MFACLFLKASTAYRQGIQERDTAYRRREQEHYTACRRGVRKGMLACAGGYQCSIHRDWESEGSADKMIVSGWGHDPVGKGACCTSLRARVQIPVPM